MRERGHGRIINVASIAGQLPMGAYSAIKAWATVYSEGLANELAGTGITVTALLPGWVHTEFHERASIRKSSIPDCALARRRRPRAQPVCATPNGVVRSRSRAGVTSRFPVARAAPSAVDSSFGRSQDQPKPKGYSDGMTTSGAADAREARLSARRLQRFTSRAQAAARFIAQRAILKPVVWSVVRVDGHRPAQPARRWAARSSSSRTTRAISTPRSSSARFRAGWRATSPPAPPPTTSSTSGGAAGSRPSSSTRSPSTAAA